MQKNKTAKAILFFQNHHHIDYWCSICAQKIEARFPQILLYPPLKPVTYMSGCNQSFSVFKMFASYLIIRSILLCHGALGDDSGLVQKLPFFCYWTEIILSWPSVGHATYAKCEIVNIVNNCHRLFFFVRKTIWWKSVIFLIELKLIPEMWNFYGKTNSPLHCARWQLPPS
jgi:hypothetical protein